ncbi:adhesion G-protein coupled receptor D2 [Hemiscyllium ocellatum]|uniref:adhesion G-protein coupled receptor D2 n=1 Tax=Hemiscyllium ocellatum TaxID=170820 RepID=UPI002966FB5B|nr:adhesion G-protein coupled receptor D2 [Hemiscyllium ocellatum]
MARASFWLADRYSASAACSQVGIFQNLNPTFETDELTTGNKRVLCRHPALPSLPDSPLLLQDRGCFLYRDHYYDYVAEELPWARAERWCRQRFGFLAAVSTAEDNQKMTSIMQAMRVTKALWIGAKIKEGGPGTFGSHILTFSGRTDTKYAKLLKQFPQLHSVTVCAQVQFDSNYVGVSTVFSYSVPSFINEFQLRANIVQGQHIQLALLVHGVHSPYSQAVDNNGRWHHLCVRWARQGGDWAIAADGAVISSGEQLYVSDDIGAGGVFIIGQEQDTFGGSFKKDESFVGNITQLHIWDRVLNADEIRALVEDCLVISLGLFFQWNISSFEIETSLQVHEGFSQCKDIYEQMQNLSSLPPSPFFLQVKANSIRVSIADYLLLNQSDYPENVSVANYITSLLCEAADQSHAKLTSTDLLALTRFLRNVAELDFESEASNSKTILSLATNYIKLASKIIDVKYSLEWLLISEVIRGPYVIIHSVDTLAEKLSDILFSIGPSIVLSTENIDMQFKVSRLSSLGSDLVYKPKCLSARNRADEIQVPDSEMSRLLSSGYSELIFINAYYRSVEHHLAPHNLDSVLLAGRSDKRLQINQLQTAVISSTVRDPVRARNIPTAVQYSLSHRPVVGYSKVAIPACVFWNFSLLDGQYAGWSNQGCQVIQFESEITICFCNHTTNFAVLMQFTEVQWGLATEVILNKLTFIGSGASLCALVVTLTLFTVLDIPKSDRTSIHKNLFVALIAAQVILLSSDSATNSEAACTAVTALLHLFFMAAFAWMMVEGLLLWSKVVTVNLSEERRMKYYYLIGWGLPVLIVTITLAAAHDKYISDRHCWLNVHNGVIWAFVGPVIFIIMVNMFVLTRVVLITMSTAKRRATMLAVNSSPIEQAYDQIRAAVKAVLVLLPILGLTWLSGVLVPLSVVMAYIFVILNSLQIRSTIKRLKERRRALNFSNCATSRPSSSLTSSRPASSPVTGSESLAKDDGLQVTDGLNLQGICKMSFYDNSVVYENPAAANERCCMPHCLEKCVQPSTAGCETGDSSEAGEPVFAPRVPNGGYSTKCPTPCSSRQ